ncbi:CCDC90 family protein [Enterovirga aerilata]|uniref:CCDC90 family protein n=1 Tax=Enterovirga aerilata TaxID=2730920 RepID=UPI001FEEFB06|nr:CCDC90 family protein [Enterovirga sp. DB1703]
MAVAALDTLSLAKRLRAAGFTEDQAEAVTDVVREASAVHTSSLATKAGLAELKAEILK